MVTLQLFVLLATELTQHDVLVITRYRRFGFDDDLFYFIFNAVRIYYGKQRNLY